MDSTEKLTFERKTEATMICKDCAFRGELSDLPCSKCEAYPNLKPVEIILGEDVECIYYTKDSKSFS